MTEQGRRWRADGIAVVLLVVLWAAFFWRFLTPVEADQVSLVQGDFSGQFVAFGAYQAERLWAGEVPLWNPYNNGGLPFLADTQSAVFYPPRLLTVALTGLSGAWTYHALELEMMGHVLLTSLLMYALVRRLTWGQSGSVIGAVVAALTWAYGGFMTGYPPLQLALLEAAAWGPLILLGIHEATTGARMGWSCLVLSGVAYGLSLLAGHPQTAWFLALLLTAFLGYRAYVRRWRWTVWLAGTALVGLTGAALAAVQLLPAFEYLQHTTRVDFGFAAKAGGFPVQDVLQIAFPRVLSHWSPLYFGIVGLALAGIALWRRARDWPLWSGVLLIGLGFSFGGNAALYGLFYNVLPGLNLFRGQERAALVIALATSILAGLGLAKLIDLAAESVWLPRLRRGLFAFAGVVGLVALLVFILWLGPYREDYAAVLSPVVFSGLLAVLTALGIGWLVQDVGSRPRQAVVMALIVFDLFTVGWSSLDVEPVPAAERLTRPAVVDVVLADATVPPYRVDGQRGLLANYGTLWGVPDIRGISPLWLSGPHALIQEDFPPTLAWELFAVKYVFIDWDQLPVASEIVAQGEDVFGPLNLHELSDPRPFALLLDDVGVVDSDEFAYAVLADPGFDARRSIVLLDEGDLFLPDGLDATGTATVTAFTPEVIAITVADNPAPAVLSVALPDYPGWGVTVDGQPANIVRAYGGVSAIVLPGGAAEVELRYQPVMYAVGALISLVAWGVLGGYAVFSLARSRRALAEQVGE